MNGKLRKAAVYYQPPDLFYQRLWRGQLQQIGFVVISVERVLYHPVWEIRLRGTLTAQTYLLVSRPPTKAHAKEEDLFLRQLKAEVQRIAKSLGEPIKSSRLRVERKGIYLRVTFMWGLGKSGILRRKKKKAEAFSVLIQPLLRRIRN